MVIAYDIIHFGKPMAQSHRALLAGIVMGWFALRSKSILPGIVFNWGVAVTMDSFVLTGD